MRSSARGRAAKWWAEIGAEVDRGGSGGARGGPEGTAGSAGGSASDARGRRSAGSADRSTATYCSSECCAERHEPLREFAGLGAVHEPARAPGGTGEGAATVVLKVYGESA